MKNSTPVRIIQYNKSTQEYGPLDVATGLPVIDTWRIGNGALTATSYQTMVEVPENEEWQLLWLHVEYTSTATLGDRVLEHQVRLDGVTVGRWVCGVTQAPSLTYFYQFAPGLPDFTAVRETDFVASPLVGAATLLSPGMRVFILDRNTVDIGDTITVRYQYAYRDVIDLY